MKTESQTLQNCDQLLEEIADYTVNAKISSEEAIETARYVLMDTLGCGILALKYPECAKHLGPIAPGTVVPNGTRVPGTQFELGRRYAVRHFDDNILLNDPAVNLSGEHRDQHADKQTFASH